MGIRERRLSTVGRYVRPLISIPLTMACISGPKSERNGETRHFALKRALRRCVSGPIEPKLWDEH